MFFKQFGGKITKQDLATYQRSSNWQNNRFQNIENVEVDMPFSKIPGVLYRQLTNKKKQIPDSPIPVVPFDKAAFLAPSEQVKMIWYGHSAILLRASGKTVLIDPMLGPDTTPIAPIVTKRFSENTLSLIEQFPTIDVVLLTHDHYDHLDYASIQRLKGKVKQYIVALGVKRHLVSWGVRPDSITEMDWWDSQDLGNLSITFTPTQHFSGRGLTDRLKCLWGGWALKTATENIWFSGDGGYNQHFKTIGERLGPFDFGLMECGQYNDDWRPVHLFPDESVQAAIDAKVKKIMPVHWAGFALSYQHTWSEPAEVFVEAAKAHNVEYVLPELGQLFDISLQQTTPWWTS
ncbi:MAG: MBL fold metallo-hydrolase [Bacteroidota bacterium]